MGSTRKLKLREQADEDERSSERTRERADARPVVDESLITPRKVMLLCQDLLYSMDAQSAIRDRDFEVASLTTSNGAVAKLIYEHPEIVVLDNAMPAHDLQRLVELIEPALTNGTMVGILVGVESHEDLRQRCIDFGLHAYCSQHLGVEELARVIELVWLS